MKARPSILLALAFATVLGMAPLALAEVTTSDLGVIDGVTVQVRSNTARPREKEYVLRGPMHPASQSADSIQLQVADCTRILTLANRIRRENNFTIAGLAGDIDVASEAPRSTCPVESSPQGFFFVRIVTYQIAAPPPATPAYTARPSNPAVALRPDSMTPPMGGQASQSVCLPPEQLVGTWAIMDLPGYVVRIVPGQFGLDVGVRSPDYTRPGSFMWLGGPGMLRPTRSDPCFFTRNGAMSQDGMRYDPRTRTISFRPGTRGQPGGLTISKERDDTGLPYTRTDSPPPMPVRCGERDIEGQWRRRSDGMTMEVMTMNFQGGGSARVLTHPARTWPSDVPKLDNIVQTAPEACTYRARCYTLKYNAEGYFGEQEACILNYDPEKRLLTASGTHGTYELITGR